MSKQSEAVAAANRRRRGERRGPAKHRIDYVGRRFGRLVVLECAGAHRGKMGAVSYLNWKCLCDCGKEAVVSGTGLREGRTQSCGCLRLERLRASSVVTHGRSCSKIHRAWIAMLNRCRNPNATQFRDYGGRGIKVCKQWEHSFVRFAEDMGEPPTSRHTLDRIDNDGNYTPRNCRWSTYSEQNRHTRRSAILEMNGESHSLVEWQEITGIRACQLGIKYREKITKGRRFHPAHSMT